MGAEELFFNQFHKQQGDEDLIPPPPLILPIFYTAP